MGEYVVLQWLGKHMYPIRLLDWHKENTPNLIAAKVLIKATREGVNEIGVGKGKATYTAEPNSDKIVKALDDGKWVLFERNDPIHTVTFMKDDGHYYMISSGKVTKKSKAKLIEYINKNGLKSGDKNPKYRGTVIVTKTKKAEDKKK